jgi:hypothetical protein
MRNLCKVSLSLALVALLAAPALAQRQGGFGGFGGGNLLTNKSVQEELKISKEQKEKIDEAAKTVREKMQSAFQDFQGLSREEAQKKFQALTKETTEIMNKAADLTSTQKKRFAEIQLQQRERTGPALFADEEIQKQLKLTDEQKEAIKTLLKETQDKIREETKDLDRQDFRKRFEIMQKVNTEAMGKVAAKLTKEQKETWTKMKGEKFEIKFERPGRPGGGGTRPRNDL